MSRILIILGGLVLIAVIAFAVIAWRPSIAPIDPPTDLDDDAVARGAVLAAAGNCASCHTAEGGERFAGGLAFDTEFGTLYSTNITPDPETGVGSWSQAAFTRAMRQGVRRDGAHLFPAFPYNHYAKMTDADVADLYAYVMSLDPVSAEAPDNEIGGLFGWRALQGGWKLLYFKGGQYRPDDGQDDAWNRGAYLAEGLGHCAACHSPRNGLGAEQGGSQAYAGAFVNGWYAPAINAEPDAPLPWTEDELYAYLREGASPLHGIAGGSMSEVVHEGLAALPDDDVRAIAVYLAAQAGAPEAITTEEIVAAITHRNEVELSESQVRGEQLFVSYCLSCHYNQPTAPAADRPALALNSAVTGPDPTMLLHAIVNGVSEDDGHPTAFMFAFAHILTDSDVADIADYLHAVYGETGGDWNNLEARARALR